jgi:hypothetical protein
MPGCVIMASENFQTSGCSIQKPKDKKKLYSLHEPAVDCISKGKAHKRYEFGTTYALLINTADRQGDLRKFTIGIDITRKPDGLWHPAIRQSKTHRVKELGPLWPGTSGLIDAHLLADRPPWMIDQRARDLNGANLLTLSDQVVHKGFINIRLQEDFKIHGHLVRTLLTDLVRRERPDARWAAQHMLGHTDRYMQGTYRSDFAESGAIRAMDQCIAEVAKAGQGPELSGRQGK